jgi:hypothetical protein
MKTRCTLRPNWVKAQSVNAGKPWQGQVPDGSQRTPLSPWQGARVPARPPCRRASSSCTLVDRISAVAGELRRSRAFLCQPAALPPTAFPFPFVLSSQQPSLCLAWPVRARLPPSCLPAPLSRSLSALELTQWSSTPFLARFLGLFPRSRCSRTDWCRARRSE